MGCGSPAARPSYFSIIHQVPTRMFGTRMLNSPIWHFQYLLSFELPDLEVRPTNRFIIESLSFSDLKLSNRIHRYRSRTLRYLYSIVPRHPRVTLLIYIYPFQVSFFRLTLAQSLRITTHDTSGSYFLSVLCCLSKHFDDHFTN